jgi:hypothetical protein
MEVTLQLRVDNLIMNRDNLIMNRDQGARGTGETYLMCRGPERPL